MVFRVVSQTTQQFGHSLRCRSSLVRISPLVFSSRKSLSSARNSLHVSKGVISLAFEETRQFVAQLQPGPQQAALHGRHAEIKCFSGLFRREPIHIAEGENRAIDRREFVDDTRKDGMKFFPRVSL